jgi:hypothetical protein
MKTITAKTSDKTMSTGSLFQSAISKHGYASLEFHVHQLHIGLSIEGIETPHGYFLKPKNDSQKRGNQVFVNRFVTPCENSDELRNKLGI